MTSDSSRQTRIWWKRCLNDFPRPIKYNEIPSYEKLWEDVYNWFHKWFLDYMPNLCEDCDHFINGECEELNIDGPLLVPVLPTQHPTTGEVIICPWYTGYDSSNDTVNDSLDRTTKGENDE